MWLYKVVCMVISVYVWGVYWVLERRCVCMRVCGLADVLMCLSVCVDVSLCVHRCVSFCMLLYVSAINLYIRT